MFPSTSNLCFWISPHQGTFSCSYTLKFTKYMLSIANEVNPLIFCYVCFVCSTNYVFSTISYLFHSLLLKLSNKIIKWFFQNDFFFFFLYFSFINFSIVTIRFFFFSICFGGYFSYPFFHYLILGSCTLFFFLIMKYSYIHNFLIKKNVFFFLLSNIFFIILFFYSIK